MIPPGKALELIWRRTPVLGEENVGLESAVGRVLARNLAARIALPPFDHSAMDGYAVRSKDLEQASSRKPVSLDLSETLGAGSHPLRRLASGETARIMTGAPLPPGADSVVMQERVLKQKDGRIVFAASTRRGSHIRERGEDVSAGRRLLEKGAVLRPYEIALLAAQGYSKVPVVRLPRAAVLATGDELVEASARALPRGRVRDSNGPAIRSALERWGVPSENLGLVGDDPRLLLRALAGALRRADIVILSGGMSVGDFDFTRALLPRLGVREAFWGVAIKPGKPLLFGVRPTPGRAAKLVFGLPGNPVAALVCLEEFVRPALEKLQGLSPRHPSYHLKGRALNDYPKPKDRQQFIFCRARPGASGYELEILRPQGSAMMAMAARANALASAPVGAARVRAGDSLDFRWLK